MRLTTRIKIIKALTAYHLFGIKTPLYVDIKITDRCNLKCPYCKSYKFMEKEMNKATILKIIDELNRLGTAVISINGGEPWAREDFEQILQYIIKKNIYVVVKTNGTFLIQKKDSLKGIGKIKLSLDGVKEIQDTLRGKGAFKKTIEAAEFCKKNKINMGFNTTVSKMNLNQIEFLLKTAKKYNAPIDFSPLINVVGREENITHNIPSKEEFSQFFGQLLKNKKYRKYISNSKKNLDYFRSDYINNKKIKCFAGKLFCRLNCDRTM